MDLAPFRDFLIACVGASASFIGLLFVALSVVMGRQGNNTELAFNDRRLAESAFTALANVFFVSLVALIPSTNIGWPALVMAILGLRTSYRLIVHARKIKTEIFWISTSVLVYSLEAIYAIILIFNPMSNAGLSFIIFILIALFGGGLIRSWELTGIRGEKRNS